jgi:branched-chain amino acid transport system ATP-binding protein
MLEVKNLQVCYGTVQILWDVSLNVGGDEMVSLLGPNGSGKSTLLKSIVGLVPVQSGKIMFDGKDITGSSTESISRRGISLVPEGRQIFGSLSVLENLLLGAYNRYKRLDPGKLSGDLDAIYTLFPALKEKSKDVAGRLSGGQQQMLAIARGMMSRPKLLILDEASLGLAPLLIKEIYKTITILHSNGMPVLFVEQHAIIALGYSQRAYAMQNGKIVLSGSSKEMAATKEFTETYFGSKT